MDETKNLGLERIMRRHKSRVKKVVEAKQAKQKAVLSHKDRIEREQQVARERVAARKKELEVRGVEQSGSSFGS